MATFVDALADARVLADMFSPSAIIVAGASIAFVLWLAPLSPRSVREAA